MFDGDGFDFGDAIFIGGAIGMAQDLINGEEKAPDELDIEDEEFYENPRQKSVREFQRLDPKLYSMVVSVMKEQEAARRRRRYEMEMKKEMEAILAEAIEFERSEQE